MTTYTRRAQHSLSESVDALNPSESNNISRQMHLQRYLWASNILKLAEPKSILDIACGRGYGSKVLSGRGSVLAVDICPETIDYAKNRYGNKGVNFILGDMESEEFWRIFPEKSIDAIVSFETIEHSDVPDGVLYHFHKVLSSGGLLFLSVPNGLVERTLKTGQLANPYHVSSYSPEELQYIVQNAGFRNIQIYGQGPVYGFAMGVLRKIIPGEKSKDIQNENDIHKQYVGLKKARDSLPDGLIHFLATPRKWMVKTSDALVIKAEKLI